MTLIGNFLLVKWQFMKRTGFKYLKMLDSDWQKNRIKKERLAIGWRSMRQQETMTSHGLLAKAIFAEIKEYIIERKFKSPAVRHLIYEKRCTVPRVWLCCCSVLPYNSSLSSGQPFSINSCTVPLSAKECMSVYKDLTRTFLLSKFSRKGDLWKRYLQNKGINCYLWFNI